MVGVGGGIPSPKNDIRLGDIVVSYPQGTFGGVIQYDLGKQVDGHFERVGQLNSPPILLQNQLNDIQSIPGLGKSIAKLVDVKFPEDSEEFDDFFKEYRFNPERVDKLYNSSRVVCRPNPKCFYGNIGSGNRVMKDEYERDLIAKEGDLLCFEMEAAGLMNTFKCIVIRGICDYCDSHKQKEWQPYAAAVAAAFARTLLFGMVADSVKALKPVRGE